MPEQPEQPEQPESPENEGRIDDPKGLLLQRIENVIAAFLLEYDTLDLADAVATLEKVKFDILFDISWQTLDFEDDEGMEDGGEGV